MDSGDRIRRAGRRLRKVCTVLIWGIPFLAALYWLGVNYAPDFCREALRDQLPVKVQGLLPVWALFLAYLATMLWAGVVIYGLVHLRGLFALYEQGRIFELENVARLKSVGKAVIAWSIAETFCNAILGIVVTLHHPPGQTLLYVGISSAQVLAFIGGFMVLTIAWVMEEGRKLQAEQSLIV